MSALKTSIADAERLLRSRSLFALGPCRDADGDAVVIAALDEAAVVHLHVEGRALLRQMCRRHDRVAVFAHAQSAMRWLLAREIDVARPVCVRSLKALSRSEALLDEAESSTWPSPALARERASDAIHSLEAAMAAVDASGQKKVARLECLVTRAFAALEHRGLPIDHGLWSSLIATEKTRLAGAKEAVFALAGDHVPRDLFGVPDINLDADADVRALLKRATGTQLESTAKWHLAALGHPLADAILAYREPWKLVSTYGDSFLAHVEDIVADADGRRMGRIRSSFVPIGASTGRVACREPNLQNLPNDARFHEALRAPAGRRLITADYATCELRIVAELAEDPVFLAAFARGEDLHSTVATTMFGVRVSKSENAPLRQRAKAINFGLVYGMGAAALGASLGVDRATGEDLLARYFKTFPRIRDYLDGAVDTALRQGFSETILGRRLRYDPITLAADNARGELGRIMKNMPIQGTSADMTKLAMVRIHERLGDEFPSSGLVNTIHDELVVESDVEDADAVAAIVHDEMADAHRTLLKKVPPLVEVHVGPTWHH